MTDFAGNSWEFSGQISLKTIGKKQPILWEFSGQVLLESDPFFTDLMNGFN